MFWFTVVDRPWRGYQLVSNEGAKDRGPWNPRRGFKEKGEAEPDPHQLLGEEWAAVGEGEQFFQQMGPVDKEADDSRCGVF